MRKMIILFLTAMLCLASFTSAFAATVDSDGYYRADYTIPADKTKYAPSSIYGTRNWFSFSDGAHYELQECTYSGDSSINSVMVYFYNRDRGEMTTASHPVTCGETVYFKYDLIPKPSEQCKPVTMKINSDHYSDTVVIKARFIL